jgi:hypothetical protein
MIYWQVTPLKDKVNSFSGFTLSGSGFLCGIVSPKTFRVAVTAMHMLIGSFYALLLL